MAEFMKNTPRFIELIKNVKDDIWQPVFIQLHTFFAGCGFCFLVLIFFGMPSAGFSQDWQMQQAPLMTDFANDVDPNNVLPEYPRPQMEREEWMNLNGVWQFQPASEGESLPDGDLSQTILVPFAVESALSGVMESHDRLWYRRTFKVPESWTGQEVLLHFGAVDYEAEVFVNGTSVGEHTGGFDPFSFNITPYLIDGEEQEVTVRVYDPTDDKGFPRGKQTLYPGGIMYTSVTGIWQTVWIEPVKETHIEDIEIVPDIDRSLVNLEVHATGPDLSNATVEVDILENEEVVNSVSGDVNTNLPIDIPNQKLWSPDDPFLYDMQIRLKQNETVVDTVDSYFGMRKISYEKIDGQGYAYLNNEHLFQMGPLDQGYWPDGLYTAPTDEALRYDLKVTKDMGFNMTRKHLKVEPARWYYWADKMGLLVWQDMPSPNSYIPEGNPVPSVEEEAFESELVRMIETLRNHPSVSMWVIFNEAQAQHNTEELVELVKSMDTTRLVNPASGWEDEGGGDVLDYHHYPEPISPSDSDAGARIKACGEFGGIAYEISDHTFPDGFGYTYVESDEELFSLYREYMVMTASLAANDGLNAGVYTEITDVEKEVNGLMTYDRKVIKGDTADFRKLHEKVINDTLYHSHILPASVNDPRTWKYTTSQPASSWQSTNFDDGSWQTGEAGFGTHDTPGGQIRTVWDTGDIWLRQEFYVGDISGIDAENFFFNIHHDEDVTIYINGTKVTEFEGYTTSYQYKAMGRNGKSALKPDSKNTIAVHCHQTEGGQYIDVGITLFQFGSPLPASDRSIYEDRQGFVPYPNPTSDYIHVAGDAEGPVSVSVKNIAGVEVLSHEEVNNRINVAELPRGVYLVKVTHGDTSHTYRILKD